MKMNKVKSILLKILGTIALPAAMFLIVFLACNANNVGKEFLDFESMEQILTKSCLAALIAMGLSTQILNGRFDFSGGITIILSAFVAGHLAQGSNSLPLYMLLCVVISLCISMVTATAYKFLKLPMIICSIALTLVYESLPRFLFNGQGLQLFSNPNINIAKDSPVVFIILFIGVLVYFYFKDLSSAGTKARLLSNNQLTAVNIGINETKNLYITYIVSGILFGLAAIIYGADNWIQPGDIGNLSTTSVAFSNIVPVYIGMFIGLLSYGWVGVLAGAITIQILNKGLGLITNGNPTGYYNIFFGIFMLVFWTLSAELDNIKKLITLLKTKLSSKKAKAEINK